jgi:cytochrome P450
VAAPAWGDPQPTKIADESLDCHAEAGRIKVVGELGRHVPIRFCGDYFGFLGPSREVMYCWSRATQNDMFKKLAKDSKVRRATAESGAGVGAELTNLLAERGTNQESGDAEADILDRLLQARFPAGVSFDESRILANVAGFLIGSGETTSQATEQRTSPLPGQPRRWGHNPGGDQTHRDALRDPPSSRNGAAFT